MADHVVTWDSTTGSTDQAAVVVSGNATNPNFTSFSLTVDQNPTTDAINSATLTQTSNGITGTESTTAGTLTYLGYSSILSGLVSYPILFFSFSGATFAFTTDPAGFSFGNPLVITSGSPDFLIPSENNGIPCFTTGTLIRTARGEVAVEDLAVGELAVTASGLARRITWIGHRRIERPSLEQQPVRVVAGAFGAGSPARDLRLSQGHAVCVEMMGEVLAPIGQLINGATIVREEVAEVTYWHVELESHDVLLAEGLPCESYLDTGNRASFGRAYGRISEIDAERTAAASCRPFVDAGPIVEAIRQRLAAQAAEIERDPDRVNVAA
jgi:hypothetical protein